MECREGSAVEVVEGVGREGVICVVLLIGVAFLWRGSGNGIICLIRRIVVAFDFVVEST